MYYCIQAQAPVFSSTGFGRTRGCCTVRLLTKAVLLEGDDGTAAVESPDK